jgi:tRNA1Val (adenine37-N6)-methyltransferase
MSNSYFQFKQFTVHQERCAMKVCTDACLFGAWIAEKIKSKESAVKNILDIGAGTGLLSLMLAQKSEADIDAVEIDESAVQQATDNTEASPWANRMQLIQGDIRTIHLGRKYDLIISNPPFFENNLRSHDIKRNLALHSDMLGLDELIRIARANLSDHGSFAVLLPYERKDECVAIAHANGLYLSERADVRQSDKHSYFRSMLQFSTRSNSVVTGEISIREGNNYSSAFVKLLKDYYLHL